LSDFESDYKILLYFALDTVNYSNFRAMSINFRVVLVFLARLMIGISLIECLSV